MARHFRAPERRQQALLPADMMEWLLSISTTPVRRSRLGWTIARRSLAQLVEPSPGRFVASQSKHPLQAQGADAVLLARHKPHRKEPHPQRLPCAVEHHTGTDAAQLGSVD